MITKFARLEFELFTSSSKLIEKLFLIYIKNPAKKVATYPFSL